MNAPWGALKIGVNILGGSPNSDDKHPGTYTKYKQNMVKI